MQLRIQCQYGLFRLQLDLEVSDIKKVSHTLHYGPYYTPSAMRRQAQRKCFLQISARRSYNFYIVRHV